MAKRMRFGIASKINLSILILICLTFLILSRIFINSQINTVKAELKSRGEVLARNLAYNAELGVLAKDRDTLDKLVKGLAKEKDVARVSILDNQNNTLSEIGRHSQEGTSYFFKSPIKTKVIPASMGLEGVAIVSQENLPEEKIGEVYLDISLTSLYQAIYDIRQKTLLLTSVLIFFAFILTILATKFIMGPLLSLVEATHKVAEGDLSYKIKKCSNDEIGDLALSFNEMTGNLKTTYEKLEKRTQELEVVNKELKDAQYKLIQSAKMAAIGQLGAGVAHELNNPLAGILGYAQYTLQKARKPGFTPDDFHTCSTYLEYIEREALRCKTIVENLLKFSRGPKAEAEDVDMNKVIKETIPLTGHGLRAHKVNIIENYDPELPIIRGSFNKLQQVMVNMVLNAQQAMPDGGQLKLTTRTKRDENKKPLKVIVEIEDTGVGIPPEILHRLFEPFLTTKQDSKGTGLGLAVSYEIVQEHRGEIDVESQVNKGTKFTITLSC